MSSSWTISSKEMVYERREKNVSRSKVDEGEDGCRPVGESQMRSITSMTIDYLDDDDEWKTSLLSGTSRSVDV